MRPLKMLPLSIAAHAIAILALVIIPLAAEVELPPPAPVAQPEFVAAKAIPVPTAPLRTRVGLPSRSAAAVPVAAGYGIAPEPPGQQLSPQGISVDGGIGIEGGVPGGLGTAMTIPEPPPPAVAPAPPRIVPIGGNIREPRKVFDVRPVYPLPALSGHVEGTVILEAVINDRGLVEQIRVRRSVPLLDGAAIEAVRQWRYTPTLLNGEPVQVLMTITIRFSLRE